MFIIHTVKRFVQFLHRKGQKNDNNDNNNDNRCDSREVKPTDQNSSTKTKKTKQRALLIGNNYPNSSCPLNGCVNDVNDMREFLIATKGWSAADIEVKTEATKIAMVQGLCGLALTSWTHGLDIVYIHFSGHGTQVADKNGDETNDGLDEALCPSDYETSGMVTDDFLNSVICSGFNPRTKVRAVFDACHSGSCLDLPYTCDGKFQPVLNPKAKKESYVADVQLLSGCRDAQTSADTTFNMRPAGALTNSLLRVLRAKPNATALQVLNSVHALLAADNESQFPLLSGTRFIAPSTSDAFI